MSPPKLPDVVVILWHIDISQSSPSQTAGEATENMRTPGQSQPFMMGWKFAAKSWDVIRKHVLKPLIRRVCILLQVGGGGLRFTTCSLCSILFVWKIPIGHVFMFVQTFGPITYLSMFEQFWTGCVRTRWAVGNKCKRSHLRSSLIQLPGRNIQAGLFTRFTHPRHFKVNLHDAHFCHHEALKSLSQKLLVPCLASTNAVSAEL